MTTQVPQHKLQQRAISVLKPYPRNARKHSKAQVKQIAKSITRFGFLNPVLVDDADTILAGHGRVEAARLLGREDVPVLVISHLNAAERRAYLLADNKIAQNAHWDIEILADELKALVDLDFEIELTGFSLAETDKIIDEARNRKPDAPDPAADRMPALAAQAVSRPGDLWQLGHHRLLCGDARVPEHFQQLLGNEQADLVFTDPPYNVRIDGNVGGFGKVRHREFDMASGEMSRPEFTAFLKSSLGNIASHARDGAIAFVCMDWRHMGELLEAGSSAFSELKNLCVWNKTNGGMGTFYRSKHELVFVYKVGTAPHINTFELGQTGRYRTNVWDYPGISSLSASRAEDLAMHPTVKPVALVADAIKDCSKRGQIVLDPFGGSGSTLIAAESCGRRGRLIEYDPLYCDLIINRWQAFTGKEAVHAAESCSFQDVAERRTREAA